FITKGLWDVSPEYQPDGQLSSEKAKDMIEKAMKEGSNFFEWQHMKADGKEFHATVLLTRVDLEGRELLQATVRDITKYKQAMESLLKSETKYRTLVDNIPQKVFIKDLNSVYVSCNESYAETLKIKSSDIVGKTDYDFFPKELAEKYRTDDKRIIGLEKTESIDEKFVHNGEEIIVNTVKTPVKDEEGNIAGLVGIFWDITDRKRTENAIKTACEQLEQSNRELKDMHCQLVQNEKLASIGQLAAGVAHEMNTPVGFVASNFQTLENYVKKIRDLLITYDELIGQIETLGKTELRNKIEGIGQFRDDLQIDFILEDIRGLFDESREGLERVTSIVQNLRDFSRVDLPGNHEEYNINKGIEATLVVVRNEIKYHADVRTEFSEVPPVFCHSGQINQIFLNVLLNAAQAIKSQEREDRGNITIRTYASDDKVVCEIADDGPGIPPDNLSRIFNPFFTTKPAGKGTGLGLSISYDLVVNKHNGEFFVESTVGEGTKFTIKIPISTKENDEQEIMSDGKKNSIICG
ncbi:MAG: ATP-binding protein, partial [Anaerolineales bacterium]